MCELLTCSLHYVAVYATEIRPLPSSHDHVHCQGSETTNTLHNHNATPLKDDDDNESIVMPLFKNDTLSPLTEESEEDSEDEEEGEQRAAKTKDKTGETGGVNMVDLEKSTNMPYPIIIDPGAAESVIPENGVRKQD